MIVLIWLEIHEWLHADGCLAAAALAASAAAAAAAAVAVSSWVRSPAPSRLLGRGCAGCLLRSSSLRLSGGLQRRQLGGKPIALLSHLQERRIQVFVDGGRCRQSCDGIAALDHEIGRDVIYVPLLVSV